MPAATNNSASISTASTSESTSTPSQSKITNRFTPEFPAR